MADILKYMNDRKVLSGLFAIWVCVIVTFVVYQVFGDIKLINAAVVSALGTVLGLPALAVGVIKWRQNKNVQSD